MPSTFTTTRRVEFSDTDMAGIVHFAKFFDYAEAAEHEFFRSLGLSVMQTQADGSIVGWPRVSCSCSYKSPAFFEDVLTVTTRVERRGVKSLTFAFEVHRDETLICTGRIKAACCRFRTGEPMTAIEIPPEYDALEEAVSPSDED